MNTTPSVRRTAAVARRHTLLHCAMLGGALLAATPAPAEDFPRRFLDADDSALLAAPRVGFESALRRLGLLSPLPLAPEPAVTLESPPAPVESTPPPLAPAPSVDETIAAELADLRTALKRDPRLASKDHEAIVSRHAVERHRLAELAPYPSGWWSALGSGERAARLAEKPIVVQAALPDEFADYFRGAIAWRLGNTNAALAEWERLLARPATERRFKTTWATYMLGRALLAGDPDRAVKLFQSLRELPRSDFVDSLELAASASGWEARAHYEQKRFYAAACLYLQQGRELGDVDDVSLRWVAGHALERGDELEKFARHPVLQRVLTGWIISFRSWSLGDPNVASAAVARWLDTVEAVKPRQPDALEELALASFRNHEPERARRWLKLAPATPVTRWLQAKLLLHDGRVEQSAALLREVTVDFPLDRADGGRDPGKLSNIVAAWRRSPGQQVRGELATLRASQRQYFAALEGFLDAGQWEDAAYLAERVLLLRELKAYVDAAWPDPGWPLDSTRMAERERTALSLRWLLARRMVREGSGHEAQPYFPRAASDEHNLQVMLGELLPALRTAWDESQPAPARAQAFVIAGRLLKINGMQLIGTELAPDFFVQGGSFEWGPTAESRANTRNVDDDGRPRRPVVRRAGPTADELGRSAVEPADPPLRFHYRYIAADLLWRAAELMPDQTEEKARTLCEAGMWIKYDHPQAADRYYKTLVRKCGRTAIGKLADDLRWFPLLDANGRLIPDQPQSKAERIAEQRVQSGMMNEHETR